MSSKTITVLVEDLLEHLKYLGLAEEHECIEGIYHRKGEEEFNVYLKDSW